METLLSYHNDQAVKDKYVARFARHREMDQVIQGQGFENGRGCFVGCTLDAYDHSRSRRSKSCGDAMKQK